MRQPILLLDLGLKSRDSYREFDLRKPEASDMFLEEELHEYEL